MEDRKPTSLTSWNKIPEEPRQTLLKLALEQPELSPRELAVRFTDEHQYFVSEATVYRILKAADQFEQPTTAINQIWQTDFTYLKVTGWGWYDLSTVMDDFSRYILAWRLCQTMSARR